MVYLREWSCPWCWIPKLVLLLLQTDSLNSVAVGYFIRMNKYSQMSWCCVWPAACKIFLSGVFSERFWTSPSWRVLLLANFRSDGLFEFRPETALVFTAQSCWGALSRAPRCVFFPPVPSECGPFAALPLLCTDSFSHTFHTVVFQTHLLSLSFGRYVCKERFHYCHLWLRFNDKIGAFDSLLPHIHDILFSEYEAFTATCQ